MKLKLILTAFALVWIVLIVRIYTISVRSNETYEALAQKNTIKEEVLIPSRGNIYDRNGVPLAVNKLVFSISVKPHLRKKITLLEAELQKIIRFFPTFKLSELKQNYLDQDSFYNHDFIEVVSFIEYETILPFFAYFHGQEYIKLQALSQRHYPYGKIASHVVGYVSKSDKNFGAEKIIGYEGKTGIEEYYNNKIQGKFGKRTYKINSKNVELEELERKDPSTNQDITLNIDIKLQKFIYDNFTHKAGAVVVLDIQEGSVLAAVSYPSFDPNQMTKSLSQKAWNIMAQDPNKPFLNKIIKGLYPPGSVVKPTVSLALLEHEDIDENTHYYDGGYYNVNGRKFRCWKKGGHGNIEVTEAIAQSCDVYYYKGAHVVGIEKIAGKLIHYGFGKKTNIDLKNEFRGIVPSRKWKRRRYNQQWYLGETLITSIGQGSFLTTPLQIALNTAILANGKSFKPMLAKTVAGENLQSKFKNIIKGQDIRNIEFIRDGLYKTANSATGTGRFIRAPMKIAAKTGTAQVIGIAQDVQERIKEEDMEYYTRSHAHVTSYAPYKKPRFVVSILIEHGGHGGTSAGPFLGKIYKKMKNLNYFKLKKS